MVNNKKISVSALLLGSVVGGVLGATAGFLFAPKSGKDLRKDISDQSKKVTDKADEWKETVQEKSAEYSDKAMAKKNELKAKKRFNESKEKKFNTPSLLMGTFVGGILGASVALVVAPKPGSNLREDINVRSKEAIESAGESIKDSKTVLPAKVKTAGTKVKHKSADVTKKSLIKATEFKEVVRGNDPETLDRIVNKGNQLINNSVALVKDIMSRIDGFSKTIEKLTAFILDATDQTKDLYDDVSKKAETLKEDVVETSSEIKDEVVDHTQVVAEDAKELKDEAVETTKDL